MLLLLGGKQLLPMNAALQKHLEEKTTEIAKATNKRVAATIVVSKATPVPGGGNQKKTKETHPLKNKRATKGQVVVISKRNRRLPLFCLQGLGSFSKGWEGCPHPHHNKGI